ncbi:hypothetical protein [Sphingomonas sp. MMS24-J13]|uniref:hypothetical protein n=1 Tax=Sphingomonas sp. MMS24-J13 TaxID=3238686 RepID=UPI00384CC600
MRFVPTLAALASLICTASANAQSTGNEPSSGGVQKAASTMADGDAQPIGDFPKLSFDTLFNFELAGMSASAGPSRHFMPSLRFDSTLLVDLTDQLSLDGLFQFKPRQPLSASDPNQNLFINQGAGRREGGKMKELYLRYGNFRVGKFVQDFGRAYALLPGPYAADFIEEPEQGYEPSDMIGGEWLHVFESELGGWRQLTVSAFMVDRTFLHESFPYNEGMIHYKDGGVGNTRLPENIMVTFDNLNMPIGHWGQLTWQASVIRWGKTYGAERGERWATLGGDLAIPLRRSVASTLRQDYSQIRLYVEGAIRHNFNGFADRQRDYLSGSIEYLSGRWLFDATTTQRWTTDPIQPLQKDELYTGTIGFNLPSQTTISASVARELVDHRTGVYAGIRLTRTLTTCSRCLLKGRAY